MIMYLLFNVEASVDMHFGGWYTMCTTPYILHIHEAIDAETRQKVDKVKPKDSVFLHKVNITWSCLLFLLGGLKCKNRVTFFSSILRIFS